MDLVFFEDFCLSRSLRSDAPQLVKHLSNPSISKNLRQPPFPYTEADAKSWHDFLDLEKESHPLTARFRWVIRQCSSSILVGDISLNECDDPGIYRLGYWLAEEYWGKGIMTNAVAKVTEIAREQKVSKIVADVKKGNWGSCRVLENNGFKYIGDGETIKLGRPLEVWDFEFEL